MHEKHSAINIGDSTSHCWYTNTSAKENYVLYSGYSSEIIDENHEEN